MPRLPLHQRRTSSGVVHALYVGGAAFEHDPLKGLLLGFGLAAAVTITAELVRHLVQRRGLEVRSGHGGVFTQPDLGPVA